MFGRKKAQATTAIDTDDESRDDLGPYPNDVQDSPARQSVLERALRNVTIAMAISGLLNVAMIAFIIALFPLKQVYPYLVTFKDQNQQVVAIEPVTITSPSVAYVTEDNVRDYVVQRHSFVPIATAMDAQWGPGSRLALRTDKQVYDKFAQAMQTERTKMMTEGYTRRINIQSVNKTADKIWQVNFETEDSLGGNGGTLTADPARQIATTTTAVTTPQQQILQADLTPAVVKRNWVATMEVDYKPELVTYEQRLLNPLGFVVTSYSVTARTK